MEHYLRYALYFAPRAGAFRNCAEHWLGRDAVLDCALEPPDLGVDAGALTSEPRRYGVHATLKPPFRLQVGKTPEALISAVDRFSRECSPVPLGRLKLERIGGFFALTPEKTPQELQAFAARVVRQFDAFRAPLNESELARRKPDRLNPRQRALLTLWGYPYVMEEFRFHITLSNTLEPAFAQQLEPALSALFAPHLGDDHVIEDLCLFAQSQTGRFSEIHRFPLRG